MNALAQTIGWAFLISCAIGALIPSLNFHVVFSDDEGAIKHHHEMIEKIQKRIDRKAAAKGKSK